MTDQEFFNSQFDYRNGILYWKPEIVNKWAHKHTWEKTDLGSKTTGGYIRTALKMPSGKRVYSFVHRIIWIMHNGEIPKGMMVDHINRVRDDNRIENLRLVDFTGNVLNRSVSKKSKSGVLGVLWNKADKRWKVQITLNGKQQYGGQFLDINKAIARRKELEKILFKKSPL